MHFYLSGYEIHGWVPCLVGKVPVPGTAGDGEATVSKAAIWGLIRGGKPLSMPLG